MVDNNWQGILILNPDLANALRKYDREADLASKVTPEGFTQLVIVIPNATGLLSTYFCWRFNESMLLVFERGGFPIIMDDKHVCKP